MLALSGFVSLGAPCREVECELVSEAAVWLPETNIQNKQRFIL